MSDWIQAYFDSGIGFDLNKIEGEATSYPEPLRGYLQRFLQISRANKRLSILPVVNGNHELELLIAAIAQEQSVELHNIANAYLGTAYALVVDTLLTCSKRPADGIILDRYPGGIVRIVVAQSIDESPKQYRLRCYRVMALVLELIEQYLSRPPLLANIHRPTGRILRDLFTALRANDAKTAWVCFDELRGHHALNARNLLFLEVQIHAGLRDWDTIIQHPRVEELVRGRLPRRVSRALLKAVGGYCLPIDVWPSTDKDVLLERLAPLQEFFTREPDLDPADESAWQVWLMGSGLFEYLRWPEAVIKAVDQKWLSQLCKWLGIEVPKVTESSPLDNLLTVPPSHQVAVELLQFTLLANDAQMRLVARHLASFPAEIIQTLEAAPASRAIMETLLADDSSRINLDSWEAWFERALHNPEEELLQVALDGSDYWSGTDWDEGALQNLAENEQAIGLVRNVLPILMNWLDDRHIQLNLKSLCLLLDNLALDDIASIQDLSLARDLVQQVLEKPHDASTYNSMLDAVAAIWEKTKSINGLEGMFEIFDLLLDSPCVDEHHRQTLWQDVQAFLVRHWQRIELEARILARQFAKALLGTSECLPRDQGGEEWGPNTEGVDLHGKKLAIYSLMQGAAQRAKSVLEKCYPGLVVLLNHDHEATPALVNLSKNADYFIFSSHAAKHQAFYAVTKRRRDMIYPDGKGAMSIIRAFNRKILSSDPA